MSVIQSSYSSPMCSNSIARSGILTANGPHFVRFGTNFRFSTKVLHLLVFFFLKRMTVSRRRGMKSAALLVLFSPLFFCLLIFRFHFYL